MTISIVHKCEIIKGSDSCLAKLPPDAGKIRRFFRNLRKILGVSDKNPDCQHILRSHAALTSERIRAHRLSKWYIIHPFSQLCMWRELVVLITWLVVFFKDPFALAFMPIHKISKEPTYNVIIVLSDIILMIYHITCFFTGKPSHYSCVD